MKHLLAILAVIVLMSFTLKAQTSSDGLSATGNVALTCHVNLIDISVTPSTDPSYVASVSKDPGSGAFTLGAAFTIAGAPDYTGTYWVTETAWANSITGATGVTSTALDAAHNAFVLSHAGTLPIIPYVISGTVANAATHGDWTKTITFHAQYDAGL
jgi:hypothetical protein